MITMTKKELSSVAGYTYRRLFDIDQSLPTDGKLFVPADDGKYQLPLFVQRWVAYNVSRETEDVGSPIEDIKAKHERVKMRKTELEVMKIEGRTVEVQDVQRLWANVVQTVKMNLLRIPSKVAPRVVNLDNSEYIGGEIEKEIRDVLKELARCPMPEYDSAGRLSDEEEEDEELVGKASKA